VNQLYQQVINLSKDYLGPAAQRFIDRQVTQHLKKELGSLTPSDLGDLAKWINVSAGLLIDKSKAQELSDKVKNLQLDN